uniref:Uncharacterized protein n=1 Tax=Romanomermis culicivorax TaxID=13658 RepID=A0A915J5G4_ROMCU
MDVRNCECLTVAIATTNEVQNYQLEARHALDQLNTAVASITNNVPTVQTIDQIIGAVSYQFQARQLCVQCEIQEQAQATNSCFAALAEQTQQLISSTAAAAAACNNMPRPRPPPATSQLHDEERPDIYITIDTFWETKPALAYRRTSARIKPKAPSTDTL